MPKIPWLHYAENALAPYRRKLTGGAYLANAAATGDCRLYYWRERGDEVDFVVERKHTLTTIEVKSSHAPRLHAGSLLVGADGIELGEFLGQPVLHWIA